MSDILVDVRDLTIEFVDRGEVRNRPVRGVDLTVRRGEILGIVGETGCGKSLTAQALLGLLPPGARTTGEIWFDGEEYATRSPQQRADLRGDAVTIVFQNPGTAFNPVFTIGYQLRLVLGRHRKLRKAEAREVIEGRLADVGLPDVGRVMAAYPHELSGGMLQRAMIAMALLCDPKLLILDEPTTALDVTVARQILRLILRLQREAGFSVVLITHNLAIVRDTCDRVGVLYAGRVIETGATDDVLDHPRHPYTRGLMEALPGRHQGRLASIPGSVPANLMAIEGCAFVDRCPMAIAECREVDPGLEPVGPGHDVACILGGAR